MKLGMESQQVQASNTGRAVPLRHLSWRYWRVPVLFGLGFTALQLLIFAARFGSLPVPPPAGGAPAPILALASGLVQFFALGLLAGFLAQGLLRGARRGWRRFLLVAIAIATPIAALSSLVGGVFGPVGVLVYGLAPFALLVVGPAVVRIVWQQYRHLGPRPAEDVH